MSWIGGDDEDALSDSSKLHSQTAAGQTRKSTSVMDTGALTSVVNGMRTFISHLYLSSKSSGSSKG